MFMGSPWSPFSCRSDPPSTCLSGPGAARSGPGGPRSEPRPGPPLPPPACDCQKLPGLVAAATKQLPLLGCIILVAAATMQLPLMGCSKLHGAELRVCLGRPSATATLLAGVASLSASAAEGCDGLKSLSGGNSRYSGGLDRSERSKRSSKDGNNAKLRMMTLTACQILDAFARVPEAHTLWPARSAVYAARSVGISNVVCGWIRVVQKLRFTLFQGIQLKAPSHQVADAEVPSSSLVPGRERCPRRADCISTTITQEPSSYVKNALNPTERLVPSSKQKGYQDQNQQREEHAFRWHINHLAVVAGVQETRYLVVNRFGYFSLSGVAPSPMGPSSACSYDISPQTVMLVGASLPTHIVALVFLGRGRRIMIHEQNCKNSFRSQSPSSTAERYPTDLATQQQRHRHGVIPACWFVDECMMSNEPIVRELQDQACWFVDECMMSNEPIVRELQDQACWFVDECMMTWTDCEGVCRIRPYDSYTLFKGQPDHSERQPLPCRIRHLSATSRTWHGLVQVLMAGLDFLEQHIIRQDQEIDG
eukprot:gene16474-22696_t